jgi:hypothetical protein
MGRTARSLNPGVVAARSPRPRPAAAGPDAVGHASPARALQEELAGRLEDDAVRWSPRRTLGFVALTCGAFWTAVAVGVAHLMR